MQAQTAQFCNRRIKYVILPVSKRTLIFAQHQKQPELHTDEEV